MEFNQIMKEITSGLTGDGPEDVAYLQEQCEAYKDHEFGLEIVRACGRIIAELVPEEAMEKLHAETEKNVLAMEATLEEVRFNLTKKDFEKAHQLLEGLVKKYEELNPFRNDEVSEYLTFFEPMEEAIYKVLIGTEKTVRLPGGYPFADLYMLYGIVLIDLGRIDQAQEALQKALRWNPVSCPTWFEYAETYKMKGDMETFFSETLKLFKLAFRPVDLARCYRNVGFYFVEKKLFREAVVAFYISLQYEEDSKNAQSELFYISQKSDADMDAPSLEEAKALGEEYGFPLGSDNDLLGMAYGIGMRELEEGRPEVAEYFLKVVYNLTEDEEIGQILSGSRSQLN